MKFFILFKLQFCLPFLLIVTLMSQGLFAEKERSILILGDSISAGYGIPEEKHWTKKLQNSFNSQARDISIINASISGDTTQGGLSRISRLIDEHAPEFLLIELGGNDALRGYPVDKIKSNLVKISQIAIKKKTIVAIMQIRIPPNYGPKYTKAFESIFSEISEEQGLYLIPFILKEIALDADLMLPDGIHPNEKAQELIANLVYVSLYPILFLEKK